MKQYIYSFFCLFILLLSGCNYLNTEPGDVITEDRFWTTANAVALEQYCNMYYPKLIIGHGDPNGRDAGEMIKQEYQSDNLLSGGQNSYTFGHNTLTTSNRNWSWETVRGCNAFLKNYHRSPASDLDKKRYAGEILFFKALDYFNKVKLFGDVPWYDKAMDKNDPELYKGRDSREVVIRNILENINLSIEYLPKKSNVSRISKDAALLLKARICLYEGTWRRYRNLEGDVELLQEAYDAAGKLMQSEYGYSLYKAGGAENCYFDLFIQENYSDNPEIILSREYDPTVNMGNDVSQHMPMSIHGMSRDCFEEYLCSKTGLPISLCGCHTPDMGCVAEMKNRDLRLVQTVCLPEKGSKFAHYLFKQDGGVLRGGAPNIYGLLSASAERPFYSDTSTGYAVSKFFNSKEYQIQAHKGSIDAPVMRYAEVLLIRAEAGAELGKDPELSKTVNLLRSRVGFPFELTENPVEDPDLVAKYPVIKGVNKNLIREIRRERRIELFAEGYRWDDVCRWNAGEVLYNRERRGAHIDPKLYTPAEIKLIIEKVGVDKEGFITPYAVRGTLNMNFTNKHYLLNVPLDEISLNPNLLPQNPGWE